MKNIIISTNYSAEKNAISSSEIKQWVKTGEIFKHIFRYEEAILEAYDMRLIAKPFAASLLLKILARKKSTIRDRNGLSKRVSFGMVCRLFGRLARDYCSRGKFLKNVTSEVKRLERGESRLDLSGSPVYLRTDQFFGLQSGGSVGHIAGVLNHLENPIFITSDYIPTVCTKLETHVIFPSGQFRDFKELPALRYNSVFYERAREILSNRKISFIYQRYSVNHFSGIKLAKFFKVPLVTEYNGSEIWVNRWWGTKSKYEDLIEQIEMANLKLSDLVVVVSQALKDELISRGIQDEKILVNPNGVNPEVYSPGIDGTEVRKNYDLEGKIVVGFIGTFGKWHGAEVLAYAFAKLMNDFPEFKKYVRLFLIGDGITLPEVKRILSEQGVMEYCKFSGTVPQSKGPSHLSACDLLVSPHVPNPDGTPFFGSPTKLFEYMAMGKGIVASDLDQIGKILVHDQTAWMVKPGDPNSLMIGIKTLIENGEARVRLGQSARKEVVLHYTWKAHTDRILNSLHRGFKSNFFLDR